MVVAMKMLLLAVSAIVAVSARVENTTMVTPSGRTFHVEKTLDRNGKPTEWRLQRREVPQQSRRLASVASNPETPGSCEVASQFIVNALDSYDLTGVKGKAIVQAMFNFLLRPPLVGCSDDSGPVSAGLNGIAGGLDQCAGTLEANAANDITGAEFDASIQVCTNGVPVDEMSAEHICTAVWAGDSFLRAVLRNFHMTG